MWAFLENRSPVWVFGFSCGPPGVCRRSCGSGVRSCGSGVGAACARVVLTSLMWVGRGCRVGAQVRPGALVWSSLRLCGPFDSRCCEPSRTLRLVKSPQVPVKSTCRCLVKKRLFPIPAVVHQVAHAALSKSPESQSRPHAAALSKSPEAPVSSRPHLRERR